MSDYRHKRHNVSSLLYHIVCPAKYRRVIFDTEVDIVLKDVCLDIAKRYEIVFLEIGTDKDHVHFLVQSVPSYSPTKIVQIIKSLTARELFHRVPTVKKRQIPSDFVVKCQAIDIADVILSMIWRRPLVYAGGRHRKAAL